MSADLHEYRFKHQGVAYRAIWERISHRCSRWTVSLRRIEPGGARTIASADVAEGDPLALRSQEPGEVDSAALAQLSRLAQKARRKVCSRNPRELGEHDFRERRTIGKRAVDKSANV